MFLENISFETILPLIGAFFSFSFGIFIWLRAPKSAVNILFLGFCTAITYWLFGTFEMFINREVAEKAIFWDRFVYIGVVFVPSLMHHFSLEVTRNKGQRKILMLSYTFSFVFLALSRTRYFVDGLNVFPHIVHTKAMIGHHVFLVLFYIIANIMFYNLYRYYRQVQDRTERHIILYTATAFLNILFIGGSAYLPAYGVDIGYPFSYFSGIIFVILLSLAIAEREFLSVRVTVAEIFTFIMSLMFTANIILSPSLDYMVFSVIELGVFLYFGFEMIKAMHMVEEERERLGTMAKELATANAHLRQLDEQKSEFLSIASHELRTPVSVIKGYISLLLEDAYGKVPDTAKEKLQHMFSMNERLVHIINNLLNSSRIEKNRVEFLMTDVDIAKLATEAVDELRQRAGEKGILLDLQLPAKDVRTVMADTDKVHEVFINLIDNAIKYSMEKTSVVVGIEDQRSKKYIKVRVKDRGHGMTERTQANIFQRFYRADDAETQREKGTGLGLYICKRFIEGMGGIIEVEQTEKGKGTTISFTLPVSVVQD